MALEPLSAASGVLSLNCGSSSLKVALFVGEEARFRAERTIAPDPRGHGHASLVAPLAAELRALGLPITAVAHRVVHGGQAGSKPRIVDDALLAALRMAVPFAPLHLPSEIEVMEAAAQALPTLPQVACFDTGFHATIPELACRYPLPDELFARGVRRWGFHGLSYEHAVATMGPKLGRRTVIAHLGSGASLAAVADGVSVDTTMGLTPTGGLVMSSRTGDLDPGVLLHLLTHERYDVARLDTLVNRRGGLLAISGTTGDMRTLLAVRGDDRRAALAVAIFCRQVQKGIAAMAASLGGIDQLVLTGGIGARSPQIREEICAGLSFLGVRLDEQRNIEGAGESGAAEIGAAESACSIWTLSTDEEAVLARHARQVIAKVLANHGQQLPVRACSRARTTKSPAARKRPARWIVCANRAGTSSRNATGSARRPAVLPTANAAAAIAPAFALPAAALSAYTLAKTPHGKTAVAAPSNAAREIGALVPRIRSALAVARCHACARGSGKEMPTAWPTRKRAPTRPTAGTAYRGTCAVSSPPSAPAIRPPAA